MIYLIQSLKKFLVKFLCLLKYSKTNFYFSLHNQISYLTLLIYGQQRI